MHTLVARFRNLKISNRIALAFILPVLGLVWFAGSAVIENEQTWRQMVALDKLIVLDSKVSAVVHALQKERGTSAGFLGSKGERFAAKMAALRSETDAALTGLQGALGELDPAAFGNSFATATRAATQRLDQLVQTRRKVDDQALSVGQMAGFYTDTIARLLGLIGQSAKLSNDGVLTGALTAYLNLLEGKERAGLERAMGAAWFSSGRFEPRIFHKFVGLMATQRAYLDQFKAMATPDHRAFFVQTVQGPVVDEVSRLENIVLTSNQTHDLKGISGATWFDAITRKIDLYKAVEDRLNQDLATLATTRANGALFRFIMTAVIVLIGGIATVLMAVMIIRGVIRPLGAAVEAIESLAQGDTSVRLQVDTSDEIGVLARAIDHFRQETIRMRELEEQQKREEERARQEEERRREERIREEQRQQQALREAMLELSNVLDQEIQSSVTTIVNEADLMSDAARKMRDSAAQVGEQSATVAAASEEATTNVQTVAAATEEMSANINQITTQVEQSRQITTQAVTDAERTNTTVQGLSDAAQKIGEVVELISGIAEQTNLLALNATIEAARAGEAGKGFAVVAGEVKSLAQQTAKATDEITSQVAAMRAATSEAVSAIKSIGETVVGVSEISSSITAAIEQQNSATQEIAHNVSDAAAGTQEVSSAITVVSDSARQNIALAEQVESTSVQIADQIRGLQNRLTEILRNSHAGNRRTCDRAHPDHLSIRLAAGGQWRPCAVRDISPAGARVEAVPGLEAGMEVTLDIPGVSEFSARVTWLEEESAGLDFLLDGDGRKALAATLAMSGSVAA
jgi:methyl-accepting chemotaxis protein